MARLKKQDHERLDDSTISRVIELLSQEAPITKKAACEILNISYNTTRLAKIIEDFKNQLQFEETRKKQLKGKPFDASEIKYTIINYLKGDSLTNLAKSQYRSIQGIKNILNEYNIPERDVSHTYWKPSLIPDEAMATEFDNKELVWSARYNAVSEIIKKIETTEEHGNIYSIWVFGKHNEQAVQPAYELGKLNILKDLNIKAEEFSSFSTGGLFYSIR